MQQELRNQNLFKSIAVSANHPSGLSIKFIALLIVFASLFIGQTIAQGTWTPLTNQAPDLNGGGLILLSDGTCLCKSGGNNASAVFYRLTPDSLGSYANGTWSAVANMHDTRLFNSTQVLMDGRVYVAGGEYGSGNTTGEVYNPVTNTWTYTPINSTISDANSEILPDGTILQAEVTGSYPHTIQIYNPATNTYSNGPSTIGGHNESMWVKQKDSSILFVDEGSQVSERYIPATNTWIADGNVPVALYDGLTEEGPALLLPDGRSFFIGATSNTALYTPSGNTSPGSWAAGPTIPNGLGASDAAGAIMVDGKVIFCANASGTFNAPTTFFIYDYVANTLTAINAPDGNSTFNIPCFYTNFLALPNGQILYGDQSSAQYYVYSPAGPALSVGKPTISQITQLSCDTFKITGTLFNGISEGAAYGDDWQCETNYPVIRMKSTTGRIYYCKSFNWNRTGVETGSEPDTTYFVLPNGISDGNYWVVVTANGYASDSVLLTITIPTLSSSINPPAICSGTAFTYTPTSTTNGATFTWTRASVNGISNAAITTAQTTNPNEILIDTSTVPVTVVYAYTITGNGCSFQENVSVIVNPPPHASFTANNTSSCIVPDSVTFTNTTTAGGTYIWYFGDGDTSSLVNPMHLYISAGSFTVKLIATSACGTDSTTQTNFVVINPPAAPTATSPVDITCGDSVTLTATGSDTLKWFNQAVGGTLLGIGGTYSTPPLMSNTTYYVESDVVSAADYDTPLDNTIGAGGYYNNATNRYLIFNSLSPATLVSVLVYGQTAGNTTVTLWDSLGNVLNSVTANIPDGPSRVTLNFPLSPATSLELGVNGTTNLYRNTAGVVFPYNDPSGYVSITGSNYPGRYYFFYDWELAGPSCVSARTPVNVVITGGPIASFTYVQNGLTVTFTNTSTGSTSWLWNFGDGNTSNAQNPVHTYLANGTYTVTLTAYNNGCSDSTTQTLSFTVGINNVDNNNALSIYPNPTDGLFNVSAILHSKEQVQVIVTNTLGQEIYETTPVTTSNQIFTLDLRNQAKGIYFVELKTKNGSVVKKLVLN
jgi:PKD repeat protein